jgi:hypothetical protein
MLRTSYFIQGLFPLNPVRGNCPNSYSLGWHLEYEADTAELYLNGEGKFPVEK